MRFGRGAVCITAILAASGCAPGYQEHYRPAENGETREVLLELSLVEASSGLQIIPGPPIKIERIITAKSKLVGSNWYVFGTSRFFVNGTIRISGNDIDWDIGVTETGIKSSDQVEGRSTSSLLGLSVKVANRRKANIQIDWDKASIVDRAGNAHPVIHRGIPLAERTKMTAPSIVAPGAALDDFVYPNDFIGSGSRSKFAPPVWIGNNFIEAMKPGERFRLHVPLGDEVSMTECQFVFEVGKPSS